MVDTPLHAALGLPDCSGPGVLLATVGGGGKTTLLFALAQERADTRRDGSVSVLRHDDGVSALRHDDGVSVLRHDDGVSVLRHDDGVSVPRHDDGVSVPRHDDGVSVLTTTTKFTVPRAAESLPVVLSMDPGARAAAIAEAREQGRPTVLVGAGRGERGRLQGVEAAWPSQALGIAGVTFVGVEADGSAGRSFKAPASHEPVIPLGVTHVVALVGVEALGKRLESRWVHRPERVMALTGAVAGDVVTAEMIARVLSHPEGGRKGVPASGSAGAAFAVVVTRVGRDREGAREIGRACRGLGVGVVVGWDAAPLGEAGSGWVEALR